MDTETNSDVKQNTAEDLNLSLQHAKDGYANAQSVIKFIDTKTGVMTGLLTVVTAAPLALLQWSLALDDKKAANLSVFYTAHAWSSETLIHGLIIGMILGVLGILYAVHGLMARDPKRRYQGLLGVMKRSWHLIRRKYNPKHDKPTITVLFPLFAPEHQEFAVKRFELIKKGFTHRHIMDEYHVQFAEIGRILHKKLRCNQRAVSCFEAQMITYAITGISAYVVFRVGW